MAEESGSELPGKEASIFTSKKEWAPAMNEKRWERTATKSFSTWDGFLFFHSRLQSGNGAYEGLSLDQKRIDHA